MKRISKKIVAILLTVVILAAQMILTVIPVTAAGASASSAEGQTVYFKLPQEWSGRTSTSGKLILPGVYVAGGTDGEHKPWVGEHMALVEGTEDIYSYVIPGDQTKIIFNTGMQRDWQTGDVAICGGDMIYIVDSDVETKNAKGHWEPYNTEAPRVSVDTGIFNFVGSVELTLSSFNCTNAVYKVDDGEEIPYTSGDKVVIGETAPQDTDVSITLTASNDTASYSYTYVFHKLNSIRVYAQNKAGWDHMFVHCWGGESESVWPGYEMALMEDSEDVYYADVPSKTTNYKFNNGDAAYGDGTLEEQTSNLATQNIVPGVADCYVVNPLGSGDSANTGEYTSLEKALAGTIEEGKPVISVDDAAADLGSVVNVNVNLENVSQMNAYIINVKYDPSVLAPKADSIEGCIANVTEDGTLTVSYALAEAADFTEKAVLVTIPFEVVAGSTAQVKVTANPVQMFADEETRISFPSSNIVAGKITVGVDRSVLDELINTAKALDENDYTALSYQALTTALASAETIFNTVTATQEMIDEQVTALQTAINNLVEENEDGNYYYFKNNVGWENVYAYWWGSQTECPAFPGVKVSLAPASNDVYRLDLPADATGLNFNDGSNEDGNKFQTNSITGDNLTVNGNMFVPNPEDTTEKNNGIRYGGTVETYTPFRYYFKNNVGWENVYAYWWGSDVECPAFPGVKATLVTGSADVYYIDLPVNAGGINFNDGSNEDGNKFQTNSITGDNLTVNGNMFVPNPEDTTEKNNGIRYGGTVETYAQRKIYFANTAGWDEVYCYWWGGSSEATACPAFPGVPAKLLAGTTDIYYAIIGDDATGYNFSNGKAGTDGGEQTNSTSTFEPGKLLLIDLASKYEKNGGYRYAARYVDLNAYLKGRDVLLGDVNADNEVSLEDAVIMMKSLAGASTLDTAGSICGDVNFDGDVTLEDAVLLQKHLASCKVW